MPEISQEELDAFNKLKADQAAAVAAEAARKKAEGEKKLPADDKDKPDPNDPGDDLQARARREREAGEKDAAKQKRLESSLRFQMGSEKFLKDNATLLPAEIGDIFKQAEKENYGDAIEKDGAIKAGIVQAFFAVQANVDLLTAGQKAQLDDYLKLTKNGKQEKAQSMYDMVFEPAFEMLRRTKKAEALQKGHGTGDDDGYKQRLIAGSKKHYLGESKDA